MSVLDWLDELAHYFVDGTILIRWLFEIFTQAFFALWQPVRYIFVFLQNLIIEVSQPITYGQPVQFFSGVKSVLEALPEWSLFATFVVSAFAIGILMAILKHLPKS